MPLLILSVNLISTKDYFDAEYLKDLKKAFDTVDHDILLNWNAKA